MEASETICQIKKRAKVNIWHESNNLTNMMKLRNFGFFPYANLCVSHCELQYKLRPLSGILVQVELVPRPSWTVALICCTTLTEKNTDRNIHEDVWVCVRLHEVYIVSTLWRHKRAKQPSEPRLHFHSPLASWSQSPAKETHMVRRWRALTMCDAELSLI